MTFKNFAPLAAIALASLPVIGCAAPTDAAGPDTDTEATSATHSAIQGAAKPEGIFGAATFEATTGGPADPSVTFSGTNFGGGETVQVSLYVGSKFLASTEVTASVMVCGGTRFNQFCYLPGAFSGSITIPESGCGSTVTVQAFGMSSGTVKDANVYDDCRVH